MGLMKRMSRLVIGSLERFFYWWGKVVTRHPYPVILTSLLLTALASVGFLKFRMEHKANLLWIPLTSPYNTHQAWLDDNFKKNDRPELVIYQSDNVLTPQALKEMLVLHQKVMGLTIDGKTFNDICTRLPIADIFQTKRRRKRQAEDEDEDEDDYYDDIWDEDEYEDDETEETPYVKPVRRINYSKYGNSSKGDGGETSGDDLPADIYCDLIDTLNEKCFQWSLLEMWRFNEAYIGTATQQEIIDAVNLLTKSPWFGYDRNFTKLLGGIERNSTGHVVAARTAQMFWSIKVPEDGVFVEGQGSGVELELADQTSLDWEEAFVATVLNSSRPGAVTLPNAGRSFSDISSEAIYSDAWLVAAGYILMFSYTILMLGKWNSVEVRLYLSVAGILGIGMGLVIGLGITSVFGFPYTPMHSMLPFLCLGIGIDDMFVIVQCWTNLRLDPSTSITEKMGLALQHAGVSITVTSLTDIFAFGVGAITRMPGLESFCVGTSVALAAIFLLQVTWFIAWMSLDERRVAARRDGVLPCITHPEGSKGVSCTPRKKGGFSVASMYQVLLSSKVLMVLTCLLTGGLFGVGAWGWRRMRMKFDPVLLLPGDSYLRQWLATQDTFYPDNGWTAEVYSETFDYTHLDAVDRLVRGFEELEEKQTIREVSPWWTKMKGYVVDKKNFTAWQELAYDLPCLSSFWSQLNETEPAATAQCLLPADEEKFSMALSDFLFSSEGTQFKKDFIFNSPLSCGLPAPRINVTKFNIDYYVMLDPEVHIPTTRAVSHLLEVTAAPYTFHHSKIYAAWETDEIIGFELWRNIGLAMAAVFIVTLLLLANLQICVYVMCIVTITLTDIVGFLHFWGITIDIISCVNIVLAIGLCVDYSVHIGLAYMVAKGSRRDKAVEAITAIGPAVLNGGITTFLALVLCSLSYSQVFITFFKVFLLTVVFGLFHGLVLFPVLLSLTGPTDTTKSAATSSLTISSSTTSTSTLPASGGLGVAHIGEAERKAGALERPWVDLQERQEEHSHNL